MRLKQARALCPGFIRVPARPERYAEVSTGIMHALLDITPDVEVFSVDEAFLDITRCQAYWNKSPETMPYNLDFDIKKKVLKGINLQNRRLN